MMLVLLCLILTTTYGWMLRNRITVSNKSNKEYLKILEFMHCLKSDLDDIVFVPHLIRWAACMAAIEERLLNSAFTA
jgi:hypothetical protein